MKTSVKVAFCGIVAALISVVMTASFIPNVTFAVPAVAGLLTISVFAEAGVAPAVLCFVASGILSFFISDRTSWLLYLLLFGYYPIVKPFIEKIKSPVIRWAVKLLIFNAAACACYAIEILIVDFTLKKWLLVAVFLSGNLAFLLYDIAVSKIAALYYARLRVKISSIFKR